MEQIAEQPPVGIPMVVDLTVVVDAAQREADDEQLAIAAFWAGARKRTEVAIIELEIARRDLWRHDPAAAAVLESELVRRLFPTRGGRA